MEELRRTTTYLRPELFKALKMKAAKMDRSVSDLVNQAVRYSLAEDAIDLEAIERRKNQSERAFDDFIRELRKNGRL